MTKPIDKLINKALSATPSDAYVRKEELEKANHTILDRDEEIARIESLSLSKVQQARIEEFEQCVSIVDALRDEYADSQMNGKSQACAVATKRIRQRLEQLKSSKGLVQ